MSAGSLHFRPYPGATTCIVVGPVPAGDAAELAAFRAALWIAAGDDGAAPPPLRSDAVLRVVNLDEAGPSALATALEAFVRLDARRLPSLFVAAGLSPGRIDAYQIAVDAVHAHLETQHRARVTRQRDGFRWQQHVLRNTGAYARRPLPATWRDALRGRPAFVCGAGPSLDVSAPRLAAAADRGVILAADSALRTLARHGLAADIVVSVDAAKEPARCLPDGHAPARAVVSPVSPPAWLGALPAGAVSFVACNQVTTDWFATLGLPKPPVAVAENCGATALELARFLGCAPIHLFGLDLALSADDPARRHTAGADAAVYAQSGFDPTQQFPTVPGNHADSVPTHVIGDWRALDARLAAWPAGLVVNVNDRGARLRNTTVVHPDAFQLDGPAGKSAWLAALAPAAATEPAALAAAAAHVRAAGERCAATVPALREALALGGPAAACARFRPLLADPSVGRALGGFALKLMPHLLPPVEGDAAFWQGLVDEFAELAGLAQQVR